MNKRSLLNVVMGGLLSLACGTASAQWNVVGPVAGPGFKVFSLRTMGTDLYAGGTGVAKWDGTAWNNLGRVAPSYIQGLGNIGINSMVMYNGSLYAGGDIDSVGGVYVDHTIGVAKWNGAAWEKVGTAAPNIAGVRSLVVYHNDLYAAGTQGINKWDGTTWTSVAGVPATILAVYHDELYAGGSFDHIGTATMTQGLGFAKWNGSTWTALTGFYDTIPQVPTSNFANVASMIVYKDALYVVGSLDYAGTLFVRGAAKWDGTAWSPANGGVTGNGEISPNCMAIDSTNIYLVGAIQKVNTANDSVYLSTYWDGTKWNHMFGGNAPYTSFFATENYQGKIYSAYTSLVRWDGTVTGTTHLSTQADIMQVYPNPTTGICHITLQEPGQTQVSVKNIVGATVYSKSIAGPTANEIIDLSNMAKGLYLIEVTGRSGTKAQKVLLNK